MDVAPQPPATALDFVTVVYAPEIELLRLQARSFARFMDAEGVGAIVLIVNEVEPADCVAALEDRVLPEYGGYAERVRILSVADFPPTRHNPRGWRRQQSLKLLVARVLEADRYVVLDAKNHFVKPSDVSRFVTPDGRLRSFKAQMRRASLRGFFENSVSYFGLDPEELLDATMPATTPYGLHRSIVCDLLDRIEHDEGVGFGDFFHAPGRDATEFFLYFGYLNTLGVPLDELYEFGGRPAVTLFSRFPETEEQLAEVIGKVQRRGVMMFGLHKNRVLSVNEHFTNVICDLWTDVGLFEDRAAANAYFAALRASITDADA